MSGFLGRTHGGGFLGRTLQGFLLGAACLLLGLTLRHLLGATHFRLGLLAGLFFGSTAGLCFCFTLLGHFLGAACRFFLLTRTFRFRSSLCLLGGHFFCGGTLL